MIGLDDILGQQTASETLRRMLKRGRVPHALLFHGPQGVGKGAAALAFATALLCESDDSPGCGRCHACRLLDGGNHPDFMRLERLPKKDRPNELSAFITVDQIREVSHLAALAPRRGRYRVFVFDPADRMNREAQNALLKTLEEPPSRTVLILAASRPHLLLATVRSRCFSVAFTALRTSELARLLEQRGIVPDEALARASLSEGRPSRALDLELETLLARREEILAALERLATGPTAAAEVPAVAATLAPKGDKDEERFLNGLDLVQALLRDAARAGADGEGLIHADLSERLCRLGQRLGTARAAELVRAVDRLRAGLRFNLNRTLIVEVLLAAVAGGPLP